MEFILDKAKKTVYITKQLNAKCDLVWDAYTRPDILDQWWAPKPYASRTKAMDFREGGRRFYAMVSPTGDERWAVQKYTSITPKTNFKFLNAFADENETPQLPGSDWDFTFSEQDGRTTVSTTIFNESLERLERMIEFGFREGTAAQLQNLEDLLAAFKKRSTSTSSPRSER